MTDLIRRADAIEALSRSSIYAWSTEQDLVAHSWAIRILQSLPSAEAVQIPIKLEKRYPESKDEDITDAFMRGYLAGRSSAEAVQGWIPFTRRPMTEEEQKDYPNCTFMFDCVLPDDGDEILVSNGRFVWMDTFCNDIDGCYLDGGDDIDEDMAWMPLPKPYKEESEADE